MGIMHGRITGKVQAFLQSADKMVSEMEQLVNLGTQINVAGVAGKLQISKDDLAEHLGDDLFTELTHIAIKGRALLDELGYESKSKVAPAVLLGKDPMTASVMATPYEVQNPGDPPLNGIKISNFGEAKE